VARVFPGVVGGGSGSDASLLLDALDTTSRVFGTGVMAFTSMYCTLNWLAYRRARRAAEAAEAAEAADAAKVVARRPKKGATDTDTDTHTDTNTSRK
jgi:hypothetical protein